MVADMCHKLANMLDAICCKSITNIIVAFLGNGHTEINATRLAVLHHHPMQFECVGVISTFILSDHVVFRFIASNDIDALLFNYAVDKEGNIVIGPDMSLAEDVVFAKATTSRSRRLKFFNNLVRYFKNDNTITTMESSTLRVFAVEKDVNANNLFVLVDTDDVGFNLNLAFAERLKGHRLSRTV